MDDERFHGALDPQQRAQLKFLQQRRQSLPLIPNQQFLNQPQQQQPRLIPNGGQNVFNVNLSAAAAGMQAADFMSDPIGANLTLAGFASSNPFSPTFPGSRLGPITETNDFDPMNLEMGSIPLSRRHSVAMTDAPVLAQASPHDYSQLPTSQPMNAQDLDIQSSDGQQSLASYGLDMNAPLDHNMSPLGTLSQTQPMIPASADGMNMNMVPSPSSGSLPGSTIGPIMGSGHGGGTAVTSRTGSLTAYGSEPGTMDSNESVNGKGTLALTGTGASTGTHTGPGGTSHTASGSNTLTEFTKRRNWSQRIIEEIQDFMHILTPNGKIRYASPSSKTLTGYTPDELTGRMITDFVHTDDSHLFIREFNESIASGQPLRLFYRFKRSDSTYVVLETDGHPHFSDTPQISPATATPICSGFFMMARQYPTKNAALLDSFLEHKIENERLMKRIKELRQEELEEQQSTGAKSRTRGSESHDGTTTIADTASQSSHAIRTQLTPNSNVGNATPVGASISKTMPPPAKPSQGSAALTRQNLDNLDASASRDTDVLREKMARFDNASHVETIEMLTGLRYREGERSRGISTGDTSPSLIRGDAGVPIPVDKDSRLSGERKKKQKVANEYVCTDCGTLESPEWRKGPTGPKTLCNACGLRWAKKEKKRNHVSNSVTMAPVNHMGPPAIPTMKHFNSGSTND